MSHFDPKSGPTYCHVCPDGHTWLEQNDGGVSPTYGAGGTSLTWPGYDPKTCPEPTRHNGHGYLCRHCGTHWFGGGCDCPRRKPPRPTCRKAPAATFVWSDGRRGSSSRWVDVTERQLTLDGAPVWERPADAIRELERSAA